MKTSSTFLCLSVIVFSLIGLRVGYYLLKDNEEFKKYFNASSLSNIDSITGDIIPGLVGSKTVAPSIETDSATTSETVTMPSKANLQNPSSVTKSMSLRDLGSCEDPLWCNITMPKVSYFRFDPPTDMFRWRKAQIQAMNGEQVLLKKSLSYFPNYLDFPDGDSTFRKYNNPVDVFIDKKHDLSFLKRPFNPTPSSQPGRRMLKKYKEFEWEQHGIKVTPEPYDYLAQDRAPVVKLGYFAFAGGAGYFEGQEIGEAPLGLKEFLTYWKEVKDEIQTPWIAIHSANENWGLLSTFFPNRTENWGRCCDKYMPDLLEFLNHDKTLMFMVGQHSNFTHPKLVTFPRGIPLLTDHVNRLMWDTMRMLSKHHPKNQLVFTSASNWGPRPQILKCVSSKFSERDFQGASYGETAASRAKSRFTQAEYYRRLGTSRMGLALPGLGADCFRLWESMILGTVPIFEKGYGMDKLLWRLPALLVEDFDLVTPELLRVAYIEALYHADDFQYEKLTQSFWWSFIGNVSVTKSVQTVWDRFPPSADESDFMRPFVPFDCWKTNSCGKGTKRVPKSSC